MTSGKLNLAVNKKRPLFYQQHVLYLSAPAWSKIIIICRRWLKAELFLFCPCHKSNICHISPWEWTLSSTLSWTHTFLFLGIRIEPILRASFVTVFHSLALLTRKTEALPQGTTSRLVYFLLWHGVTQEAYPLLGNDTPHRSSKALIFGQTLPSRLFFL